MLDHPVAAALIDGAVTAVPSGAGRVSTTIEAADAPRTLVLAERADPGWRAVE